MSQQDEKESKREWNSPQDLGWVLQQTRWLRQIFGTIHHKTDIEEITTIESCAQRQNKEENWDTNALFARCSYRLFGLLDRPVCSVIQLENGAVAQVVLLLAKTDLFPGFETDRLTRRDRNFCTSSRIAADATFSGFDDEYSETSEFDPLPFTHCLPEGIKKGIHSNFCLHFRGA
jgi:hypothetical protein